MDKDYNLDRFLEAQVTDYQRALSEIKNGRKQSHWMWYVFPQIKGLGLSSMSGFYGIENVIEAKAYLQHPVLGNRLIEISEALLSLETNDAHKVFGNPDDLKLKSCMTLFSEVPGTQPVFELVLDKMFGGRKDPKTLELLSTR